MQARVSSPACGEASRVDRCEAASQPKLRLAPSGLERRAPVYESRKASRDAGFANVGTSPSHFGVWRAEPAFLNRPAARPLFERAPSFH